MNGCLVAWRPVDSEKLECEVSWFASQTSGSQNNRQVGSGKSSVLAALLGELLPIKLELEEGARSPVGPVMRGSVGYCQQVPWIASGSIRDNVVFGAPWDPPRYGRVLAACALDVDLALLPAGDATELGERGINLSGGQKVQYIRGDP